MHLLDISVNNAQSALTTVQISVNDAQSSLSKMCAF